MMILTEEVPGNHPTVTICGNHFLCTFNYDTLISTGIAAVLTLAIGLAIAVTLRRRTPHRLQMVFELFLGYVRTLTRDTVSEDATFIMPLAATIGIFILLANWLDFFPLQQPVEPANADINLTLAMGLVVFLIVQWYSVRVLGFRGYLRRYTKPFELALPIRVLFVPLNLIEEFIKPITLALRLFGNIFAGLLMVYLLSILFVAWATGPAVTVALSPLAIVGLVGWKLFDVFFIGSIQAFIFMLLTVIYFGLAREGLAEEEGHEPASRPGHLLEEAPG
jgi:F-type H+-transporting ATPase subunit a